MLWAKFHRSHTSSLITFGLFPLQGAYSTYMTSRKIKRCHHDLCSLTLRSQPKCHPDRSAVLGTLKLFWVNFDTALNSAVPSCWLNKKRESDGAMKRIHDMTRCYSGHVCKYTCEVMAGTALPV